MALVVAFVRASHDEMPKISKSFGNESNRVKSSIDRLNRVIQVLEGGDWVGEGATAFYNEMRSEVMPAMARLMRALEMGATVTQQIGRLIDELEQTSAGFFSAILAAFEGGLVGGGVLVAELGGMGSQAGAAGGGAGGGGGGGGAGGSESEKPASGGGGGGGSGGGAGGGGGGGGGGSWDGEIGFKQEKPAPGAQGKTPSGRRRNAG